MLKQGENMAGEVNLSISNDVVKSIVESKIKSEVLTALSGNSERIMEQLTENIIKQKVDRDGKPTSYSDGVNLLDWMIQKEIRELCSSAIKEWMKGQAEKLKISVKKSLEKNKDKFADQLVQSLVNETHGNLTYRLDVLTPGTSKSLNERLNILEQRSK